MHRSQDNLNTETVPLRQLRAGTSATVRAITVRGHLGLRLREMGLVTGARFTLTGRAPLRDPVSLRIDGQVLTLRNREADHILVTIDESTTNGEEVA